MKKSSDYVYIFLFNDILLKTMPMEKRGSLRVVRSKPVKAYKFSDSYVLANCRVSSIEDTLGTLQKLMNSCHTGSNSLLDMKNALTIEMTSANKKCTFFLSTPEEKQSWFVTLTKQIALQQQGQL